MKGFRIRKYKLEDLAKVSPPGYRLAVLHFPFIRKFTITWWIDENDRIGRKKEK